MTLNEEKIKNNLKTQIIGRDFHFFDTVTSTFDASDKINVSHQIIGRDFHFFDTVTSTFDASDKINVSHGSVICAKVQTNGRGRLGRDWVSPEGGIYFSVILEPAESFENLQVYTNLCALSVQRAIEKLVPCFIKWPNDIVSKTGKKLCGILTKAKFSDGKPSHINVGIGINANASVASSDLPYASSIKDAKGNEINENALLCDVLLEIEKVLQMGDTQKIIDEFSKKCITLGSFVRVLLPEGESIIGKCVSIDSDGSAIIEKDDKSLMKVNSGEVSVRGIYGEKYV